MSEVRRWSGWSRSATSRCRSTRCWPRWPTPRPVAIARVRRDDPGRGRRSRRRGAGLLGAPDRGRRARRRCARPSPAGTTSSRSRPRTGSATWASATWPRSSAASAGPSGRGVRRRPGPDRHAEVDGADLEAPAVRRRRRRVGRPAVTDPYAEPGHGAPGFGSPGYGAPPELRGRPSAAGLSVVVSQLRRGAVRRADRASYRRTTRS